MGSACHLKPPVTAGTQLSVTKAGLKSPIPIPSRYFFFLWYVEVKQGRRGCRGGFCGKGLRCCRGTSSSFPDFPPSWP